MAVLNHRLLVALVAVGVAASAAVVWERHQVESGYRTVELVADSEDWRILAQREGIPADALWEALRQRGVGSVAVYEATLRRLQDEGRVTYRSGAELQDLLRTGALSPRLRPVASSAEPGSVYVMPADPEVARQVEWGFRTALGPDRVAAVLADPLVLRVRGRLRDVEETGLGFLPSSVRRWEAMGFRVVLRPRNARSFDRDRLEERIRGYGELLRGRLVVFDLNEVLGYERLVEAAGKSLKALGAVYGRVEVLVPARRMRGEEAMTRWMRPQVVRVISIPPEEVEKLTPDDAVERFVRGVRERNLRVVYLRPYLQTPGGVDAVEANLDYAARVAAAVRAAGFQLGPAGPLPELPPSPLRWGAVVAAVGCMALLGAVAAGLLGRPLPPHVPVVWTAAAVCVVLAVQAGGLRDWADKFTALGAAVAFPVLGLAHVSARAASGAGLGGALAGLWAASAVSASGGLVVAALLVDWPYRLAGDGFFGVKLATVAPALLVAGFWLAREYQPREAVRQVGSWLSRPVTLGSALAVVAVAAAGLLLLVRTGNTGLPMAAVEERV
ncbi:MAG: DUF5693 family protein, partial [Armatimonadota bacterium]|nr:DUF5693 family protein [Armatimonadota bacterium]MDW8156735.1 DUF5693 family protein [Armatimonadota bacterium]